MILNSDLYDGAYAESDFPTETEWRIFSKPEGSHCLNYAFNNAIFCNFFNNKYFNV